MHLSKFFLILYTLHIVRWALSLATKPLSVDLGYWVCKQPVWGPCTEANIIKIIVITTGIKAQVDEFTAEFIDISLKVRVIGFNGWTVFHEITPEFARLSCKNSELWSSEKFNRETLCPQDHARTYLFPFLLYGCTESQFMIKQMSSLSQDHARVFPDFLVTTEEFTEDYDNQLPKLILKQVGLNIFYFITLTMDWAYENKLYYLQVGSNYFSQSVTQHCQNTNYRPWISVR